ncbi:RHS repeat-associated core domain-containing protein [Flavihumibacter sp.]|uniref:RHS repeat-associated core domain-containing protein n=1 Tax=Flavihumibacter sp. TaxID=1913981 RepID=UPI002FC69B00
MIRKQNFSYDKVNRLLTGTYSQNQASTLDFTTRGLSYDANGNILTMTHLAWKPDASFVLDSLLYTYATNTNRLQNVYDRRNDTTSLLGDFKTAAQHTQAKTSATIDYTYDANGNMIKDLNKGIATTAGGTGITYNHLNLPSQITVRKNTTTSKGTITYTYDAAGTKLSKVTVDVSTTGKTITTTTNYIGGMVFESRTTSPIDANQPDYTHRLQFIAHEEGRVRFTPLSGAVPARFSYDYFLKDHLGNTRMVLTEEASSETYPALSFEGAAGSVELQNQDRYWENKAGQSINVAGVRTMHSTGTNAMLTRKDLGAIGAAKLLKVMSGDKIQTSVQFHYTATNANNSSASGINSLVANITQLIANSVSPSEVIKSGVSSLGSSLSSQTALANLLNTANTASGSNQAPKAYLHVLLFNDQFKFDAVNSKVIPVPYTVNSWGTLSRIGANAVTVKKNGYAYVYFSNESNELVYFDNFNLTHERGPVLEETHYYPFGLIMAGISSKALVFGGPENKRKFNGVELSSKDFSDGSGLELYETAYRSYDSQIGRFHQIDPLSDLNLNWSTYAFAQNNPILFSDPYGLDTVRGKLPKDYDPKPGDVWINKKGQEAIYDAEDGWVKSQTLENVTVRSESSKPFAGMLFIGAGMIDTYYSIWESNYDHKNYTTTKGQVRLLPTGKHISQQAKMFRRRSNVVKSTGFGVSLLANLLTAIEVRDQHLKDGIKNVNPVDAAGLTMGTAGLTANGLSYFGFAPQTMSTVSTIAGRGSLALAAFQNYFMMLDFIYNNTGVNNWRPSTGNTQNDIIMQNEYDNGIYNWTGYFDR